MQRAIQPDIRKETAMTPKIRRLSRKLAESKPYRLRSRRGNEGSGVISGEDLKCFEELLSAVLILDDGGNQIFPPDASNNGGQESEQCIEIAVI